ncbi:glycosyltransferase [Methylogaea oryzae]|uniref:glycosyltransferase n=1 Tax=Methylogaea oryzae TaxID=1295382 RepID=UPI003571093E
MNLASNLTTRSVRFVEELDNVRIAVLIPCYNEALTIGKVIKSFRHSLPFADIYVFDNNSTDDTVAEAIDAGASFEGRISKEKVTSFVECFVISKRTFTLLSTATTLMMPLSR